MSTSVSTSAAGKRTPYTGDSMLAVAVRVFNERGYDGTSMEDLARAAGITKSSIYHHVKSKEELLERGVNRALDALTASLDAVEAAEGTRPLERVAQAVSRPLQLPPPDLPYLTPLLPVPGTPAPALGRLDRVPGVAHAAPAPAQQRGRARTPVGLPRQLPQHAGWQRRKSGRLPVDLRRVPLHDDVAPRHVQPPPDPGRELLGDDA